MHHNKNTLNSLRHLLCICSMALLTVAMARAGSLTPPGPPIAGTMKPLDQVEPRIPIRQADIPLTINKTGSYYLVENVTASQTAVTVTADDVTIDLCGFTIKGSDSLSCFGIYMYGRRNVEIRNGTIRDFHMAVVDQSAGSQDIRLINLSLISNLNSGVFVDGSNVLVEKCTLTANGSANSVTHYGLRVGKAATVTANKLYLNAESATGLVFCISAGEGSRITGNTMNRTGTASQAAFGIEARDGCTVADNTIFALGDNATVLVRAIEAGDGCVISGNTVTKNGTYSVDVWGIFCDCGCTVVGNTSSLNGSEASGTQGGGIATGVHCLVDRNTAYANSVSNILTRSTCTYGTNHAP